MRTVNISLSVDGINEAIRELMDYRDNLEDKAERFVLRLAECGIAVARVNSGIYGSYISFTKELLESNNLGVTALLVATNRGVLKSRWRGIGGIINEVDINPVLMAEFGSGWHADDRRGKEFGAGQGTFPGQTHAFDSQWKYMDLEGNWHTVDGEEPTAPLDNAMREMYVQIAKVGMEVFGNG